MALTDKELEQLYTGEISLDALPVLLSQFTFDELMTFVGDGFGALDNPIKIQRMLDYNGNISAFSGAKTFQQVKDMSQFIFDAEGNKRAFKQFREFAQLIDNQYNLVWLKTEQDTAFAVAQGADNWMDAEDDKDTFPVLQYQTADDERVRHEHAEWDNLKFPVDHAFWNTRMPPNGYRCRCRTIKLTEGKTSSLAGKPENSSKVFNNNPGKDKFIFDPKKHPYFKHTKAEGPEFERAITWQSSE